MGSVGNLVAAKDMFDKVAVVSQNKLRIVAANCNLGVLFHAAGQWADAYRFFKMCVSHPSFDIEFSTHMLQGLERIGGFAGGDFGSLLADSRAAPRNALRLRPEGAPNNFEGHVALEGLDELRRCRHTLTLPPGRNPLYSIRVYV